MSLDEDWEVPSDRRARRIADACELVVRIMNLRPPQGEALRTLAKALQRLPRPLHECGADELRAYLTQGEQWQHTAHPTFTVALATGVGKTRLAGAIIALLYLTKESRTYLILAPRRAVLRRFEDALNPNFREYIFVESGWIPEPLVISGDQIADPAGIEAMPDMFRHGPTIYLLSPQLTTTSDRFLAPQAFTGRSPAEHLREKRDLVVIVDEAHHIGGLAKKDAAKWTESIRSLQPAIQIGLTATPRGEAGENILYNYPLSLALVEQLYTKDIHLLVRNFDDSPLSDDDIDRATIAYALDRLGIKEGALKESSVFPFPDVKPVCVFFGRDIAHAEWIASVLQEVHGLSPEEVLVTHSQSSKKEEEVERLLSIEDTSNPVRVVVNVQELTEGWDVRNVYVVAPLRAMATFQGALQAMGRGLRLPAGSRVNQPELDTLDVVCFGKQSLKTIVEEATTWLGRNPTEGPGGMSVDGFDTGLRIALPLEIPARLPVTINLPELEPLHEDVSVAIEPAAISRSARMAVDELDLVRLKSRFSKEKTLSVGREAFKQAATMRVLRVASQYLSDDLHFGKVGQVIEAWLAATKATGDNIEFDPAEVGEEIGRIVVDGARKRTLAYQATARHTTLGFPSFQIFIVRSCEPGKVPAAPVLSEIPVVSAHQFVPKAVIRGLDGHAWSLSLHPAYSFDSLPEARLAWLLDHAEEVEWWVRNEPRRFRILTPAGWFAPDFLVALKSGVLAIVEVKGAFYWNPPDSEARIKAASAARWTEKMNEVAGQQWKFGVALDSDVETAGSFGAVLHRLRTN